MKRSPYQNVAKRNAYALVKGTKEDEVISTLSGLGKIYTNNQSYKNMLSRGRIDFRSFVRIMIALGKNEFTINITEKEKQKIVEYEKNQLKLSKPINTK